MPRVQFDWDAHKAALNESDHGVSFDEAKEVFYDPNQVIEYDLEHSSNEDRYRIIGRSRWRLLMVVYTERPGEIIRLISAREAGKRQRRIYEEQT